MLHRLCFIMPTTRIIYKGEFLSQNIKTFLHADLIRKLEDNSCWYQTYTHTNHIPIIHKQPHKLLSMTLGIFLQFAVLQLGFRVFGIYRYSQKINPSKIFSESVNTEKLESSFYRNYDYASDLEDLGLK